MYIFWVESIISQDSKRIYKFIKAEEQGDFFFLKFYQGHETYVFYILPFHFSNLRLPKMEGSIQRNGVVYLILLCSIFFPF